ADGLAGCLLAVLAEHGLERDAGFVCRSEEVAVDAQPVHLPALPHALLADDRAVVLRLTRDDARVAADARAQVDRHRPLVALAVLERVVERSDRPAVRRGEVRIGA